MVLLNNFVQVMGQYAVFEGRASRSEFWWYVLASFIISLLIVMASLPLIYVPYAFFLINYAFALAILTPSLAVTVRRLHDAGRSAWWLLMFVPMAYYTLTEFVDVPALKIFVPPIAVVGTICNIVLIVIMALPGNSGENRYGAAHR